MSDDEEYLGCGAFLCEVQRPNFFQMNQNYGCRCFPLLATPAKRRRLMEAFRRLRKITFNASILKRDAAAQTLAQTLSVQAVLKLVDQKTLEELAVLIDRELSGR